MEAKELIDFLGKAEKLKSVPKALRNVGRSCGKCGCPQLAAGAYGLPAEG